MLTTVLTLIALFACSHGADIHLIVQPTGSDSNNGLTHPVKTLERAIERLDDADVKGNPVFIELRKGYYDLSKTITFTKNYGHPITIRSFYNKEQAHVTGGKQLSPHLFHPVTDQHVLARIPHVAHGKVRQLRFSDAGISIPQLGHISRYGFYKSRVGQTEILYNGKPLQLAKWPNTESYINIEGIPDGREGKRFVYPSSVNSRAANWKNEADLWVYGFWYWSWADDAASVASIDTTHRVMTFGSEINYGLRTGHIQMGSHAGYSQQGGYFSVFNALSELDQPGEYYIDRKSGILYLWPPEHNGVVGNNDIIYASLLDTLFKLSRVSHINFQDLILEASRHIAIDGEGVSYCSFDRLEVKNTGGYAIHLPGSSHVNIRQCDIHDTDGGVSLSGGDRRNLTPSGHLIENNKIWKFSRATAVGMNGIAIGGVGARIQFNEVTQGRYTGIMWTGNDHIIRRNHIHHLCTGSSDCGAIHAGRDWTFRGNVIEQNHIHHVLRFFPGAEVRGVMLDDQYSSVRIEGNVFFENEIHFNIGGGRDNIARYNVLYNPHSAVTDLDGRGLNDKSNDKTLHDRLKAMPYKTGIWAQKYPELASIDKHIPEAPMGNQIYKNFVHRGTRHLANYHGSFLQKTEYFNIHDNYESTHTSDFNDISAGDYRVVCGAASWASREHVPQPPTLAEVGPHLSIGPAYKHQAVVVKHNGALRHC